MFKLDLKNILKHSSFCLFPQTDSYQCGKKKSILVYLDSIAIILLNRNAVLLFTKFTNGI